MTNPSDFSSLGKSLQVIHEFALDPDQFALISDPSETEVVQSTSFFGHVWKALDQVSKLIPLPCFPLPMEEDKLERTLTNIFGQFEKALQEMHAVDFQYREGLLSNYSDQSAMSTKRKAVFYIADALFSLFPGRGCSVITRIELIQRQFLKIISRPLIQPNEIQKIFRFEKDHAMAAVEGILLLEFPLRAFSSLIHNHLNDVLEKKDLEEWINAVQNKKERLTVGLLHIALWGVLETIYRESNSHTKEFAKKLFLFEWQLYRSGCQFFYEEDAHYLSWVEDLRLGKVQVEIAGQKVALGNELMATAFTDNKVSVFEIKNNDSKLLMVSHNQAQLGIWHTACDKEAWLLQPISCCFEDPYGHYCLIDNVSCSLEAIEWKTNGEKVDREDTLILDQIAIFLEWAVATIERPLVLVSKLDVKNFFFIRKNRDVSLRVFPLLLQRERKKEEIFRKYRLFYELEDFAISCSNGNIAVFRYLSEKSGLTEKPLARFYQDLSKRMLLGSSPDLTVQDEANVAGLLDLVVIRHAQNFIEKLKERGNFLFARLQPKLRDEQKMSQQLKDAIVMDLIGFQKEMGYSTTLCPLLWDDSMICSLEQSIMKNNDGLFLT